METVAFIGIGVMGASMARHLMESGRSLRVFTRTRSKAQPLCDAGALWCESPAACVRGAQAVITMVGFPADVEEVYFGESGILAHAEPEALLIDMTTTEPALARRIYAEAKRRGLRAVDAPVSGGDSGAKNAALSIMAGGDEADFRAALPLFETMGKSIRHMGPAGSGQHTKMANQIALAGALVGAAEALAYAERAGVDGENVLAAISGGAAGSWQLSNNGPKMLHDDLAPGFYIKHFLKDLNIAAAEAAARGMELPVLEAVRRMNERLTEQGLGDAGTQAICTLYQTGNEKGGE